MTSFFYASVIRHLFVLSVFCLISLNQAHAEVFDLTKLDSISKSTNCFSSQFESFEKWVGFMEKRNPNFDRNRFPFSKESFDMYKNTIDCYVFNYLVDQIQVQGFVISPKKHDGQLPTVIYNRGGNTSYGRVVFGRMMYDLMPLAKKGFVVIGSQYRWDGSRKQSDFKRDGKNDEFGGEDVKDVLALIPIIEKIPFADENNIAVFGASRGGMQSYLFAKHYKQIKALIIKAGISNAFTFYERDEKTQNLLSTLIPNLDSQLESALIERSAVFWVDQLPEIPILMFHANDDDRVDVSNSVLMAAILEQRNRPYEFVRYQDGGHGMSKHREDMNKKMLHFLNTNLQLP